MPHAVLIVEDEPILAKNLAAYLARHGHDARVAASGEEALAQFEAFRPDAVVLDYQLPGVDGLAVLRRMRSLDPRIKVVMVTGQGGVEVAVEAMKAGASDYLVKPVVLAELKLLLDRIAGEERLEGAVAYYQGRQAAQSGLDKLIGDSPPMAALKQRIARFIAAEAALRDGAPASVLVTGETGSGKELVARAFHFDGPRREHPFVEINCAAIPAALMEGELFGFERGAFTDAKQRKLGLVETAAGGTLFLDEIGDMEPALQAKLLKLLEDRTLRRLGDLRERAVDVRVIAATNRNLEERVQRGEFRADLYFRLGVIRIEVPPLRERGKDILRLAREFLSLHARRYGKDRLAFAPDAEAALMRHPWPGNVRELRNVVEQAVLLAESGVVGPKHLALVGPSRPAASVLPEEGIGLDQVEADLLAQALARTRGNVTRAARLLGVSRDTLRYRLEKHGLREPKGPARPLVAD